METSNPQQIADLIQRLLSIWARLDGLALRAFTKHGDDAELYNGLKDTADELEALVREPEPPLVTYMFTDSGPKRDAAFLRTYATRVRDRTAASWEIPNTVASTLEDIASRIEAMGTAPAQGWQRSVREFLHDLWTCWDCDTGANESHPHYCRACRAEKLLSQIPAPPVVARDGGEK